MSMAADGRRLATLLAEAGSPGIDRTSWLKLPHQVADSLRRAIEGGLWMPGDKLPSTRVLASELGVSLRVAIEALRILAKEGRVSLCTKSRAVVKVEESRGGNHHVLLVRTNTIWHSRFFDRLYVRLNEIGYLVTISSVVRTGPKNCYDVTQLKSDLRKPYELVICPNVDRFDPIEMAVVASGNPFVIVFDRIVEARNFIGNIAVDTATAESAFVRHCVRRKVGSVVVVAKWHGDGDFVLSALKAAGIRAERWVIPSSICFFRGESIERSVFKAFHGRIKNKGTSWMPDVLYFTDDYACYGAMTAMLTHGLHVPKDVRVATTANRGSLRTFATSLTRIEYDIQAMGDTSADILLDYMRTGEFPKDASVAPVYRIGGSFK